MIIQTLRSLFSAPERKGAEELYIALVKQSREAFFYADCAVPDSLDGRFEVLVLHIFLALHILKISNIRENTELSRLVLELFFADMDRNLREMGVGDMGVGRRIQNMSKASFGRMEAYTKAWDKPDVLQAAIIRNVYRGEEVPVEKLAKLMGYIRVYKLPVISA